MVRMAWSSVWYGRRVDSRERRFPSVGGPSTPHEGYVLPFQRKNPLPIEGSTTPAIESLPDSMTLTSSS